jgi:cell division protein FtsQ
MTTLRMDERGALSFWLTGGQEVRVGRETLETRLERFFAISMPAMAGELDQIEFIDLRYSNGFSVGWIAQPENRLAINTELF